MLIEHCAAHGAPSFCVALSTIRKTERSVSDQISLKRFQASRRIRLSTPNSKSPRPLISVLVSPRFAKPAAAARAEIL
jgi:hypothetical protein